jgi:hypothetical protein
MVSIWVLPPEIGTIDDEGIVRLSDGRTFDLSSVPGNGFNANRLGKINKAIQRAIDDIRPVSSIPVGDADEGATAADLLARYGGRVFFSDADGTPNVIGDYITTRNVLIWLTWENNRLMPYCETVR